MRWLEPLTTAWSDRSFGSAVFTHKLRGSLTILGVSNGEVFR